MSIALRTCLFVLGVLAALITSSARAAEPSEWAQAYRRCAACHLASGGGVPGAYPPLDAHLAPLAGSEAGRTYLVLVLGHGLMGPLEIDGIAYRNVMPAQKSALGAAGIAAALNHVLVAFVADALPKNWRPFTRKEVEDILAHHPGVGAADVHALRRDAFAESRKSGKESGS